MQKKIDRFLKIGIVLWIIIVICFFMFNMNSNTLEVNGEMFHLTETESVITSIIFSLVFSIASLILPPINIIVIYLIYREVVTKKIRANAKFDKQNLNYCREHLNKLSPGLISFLKDFSIEPKKDISAHILKLLYEGNLIEQDGIIKRSSKIDQNLSKADLVVLKIVEQHELTFDLQKEYEAAIVDEANKYKLISFKNKRLKSLVLQFVIFAVLIFILAANGVPSFLSNVLPIFSLIVGFVSMLMMLLPFVLIIYDVSNIISLFKYKTSIVRTPKGDRILKNSLGLNKFLMDIGHFQQMNYEKVYVRGYYLIYAVVLEINKDIPKEIMKKIGV